MFQLEMYTDLSAIITNDNVIYHRTGNYILLNNSVKLIPVNRSYSISRNGERTYQGLNYTTDRLIHDDIIPSTKFYNGEVPFNIHGKEYLFLNYNNIKKFVSAFSRNNQNSLIADYFIERIITELRKVNLNRYVKIGVHGSHLINMQTPGSDLDLVMWSSYSYRNALIRSIDKAFITLGFKNTIHTDLNKKYIKRYSKRFSIPEEKARYLASKRLRWTNGILSVSIQLFCNDFDPDIHACLFNTINNSSTIVDFHDDCIVIESKECYNLLKHWQVSVRNKTYEVYSLSWMHQGQAEEHEGIYTLKGKLIRNKNKEIILLQNESHYILPKYPIFL